jgi:hypothetical protein
MISTESVNSLATPSTDDWTALGELALGTFWSRRRPVEPSAALAFAAGAQARVDGWASDRCRSLLDELRATRNPDGGYGLGRPYDAFQDGTVNPADTTYLVTITGHVGRVLLDGHEAGVIDDQELGALVDLALDFPRVPSQRPGLALAYSRHPHDQRWCVHNVNASAGVFLLRASKRLPPRADAAAVIAGIAQRQAAGYVGPQGSWRYIEGRPRLNDANHNAGSIEAALGLTAPIGQDALQKMLATFRVRKWTDPIALIRLLPWIPLTERPADLLQQGRALVEDARLTCGVAGQLAYWALRAGQCTPP